MVLPDGHSYYGKAQQMTGREQIEQEVFAVLFEEEESEQEP